MSDLLATTAGYWAGRFQPDPSLPLVAVIDPATGATVGSVPEYGATHASQAVDAATRALRAPFPLDERRRVLLGIADALEGARVELARIITAENGKPLAEAEAEVSYAAGFFRDAAGHLDALAPRELATRPRGHRWQVFHRPAGVAALITPWNFPVGMLAKKLAGALAAGCSVVIKPSELTPLSCIAFVHLIHPLGLPDGMVNLVFGRAAEIGHVLCERPEVQVLSFTGSTAVGRLLAAQCAPSLKRLSMELGGNAPFVVFADADLDRAADELMANKFRCAGQTCVCANRVLVDAEVHDAFVERVVARVRALKVGPGAVAGTDVGPLVDERAWRKVDAMVGDAVASGARAVVGRTSEPPAMGWFYTPTVLVGVEPGMRCWEEELFGPVVSISRFTSEEQAFQLANDTEYGLAAYVFSADTDRLDRAAARLHFGHIGLNTSSGPTPEAPFGGMVQSGLGREGGLEGVLEFIELQTCPTRTG